MHLASTENSKLIVACHNATGCTGFSCIGSTRYASDMPRCWPWCPMSKRTCHLTRLDGRVRNISRDSEIQSPLQRNASGSSWTGSRPSRNFCSSGLCKASWMAASRLRRPLDPDCQWSRRAFSLLAQQVSCFMMQKASADATYPSGLQSDVDIKSMKLNRMKSGTSGAGLGQS